MNCPKCRGRMSEGRDTTPEGVEYRFFRCAKCGEELVHMKQLHDLAQKYREMKEYRAKVSKWGESLAVRIPKDLAIVSFDDDHSASLMTPTLTTVRQQAYEMGARAANLLLNMLSGEPVQQQVFLPVELIVRQSCGAGA